MSEPAGSPRGAGPHVVVVGGGLAGLAAAAMLADAACRVTLVESRRHCGGRAASFEDPTTGGLVDACQHVAMGCCTNFLDLCRRAGLEDALRRDRTLWFIGPDGDRSRCTPTRWLPAPFHLAPLLVGMGHFSLGEKAALAAGMLRLARSAGARDLTETTALEWLQRAGQPERVIRLFWQPVIESALGESLDLVGIAAARKVAVDGFLAHREAADLIVPTVPLGRLFGERLVGRLESRGVRVTTGTAATAIERSPGAGVVAVHCRNERFTCDAAILAVPWRAAGRLVPDLVPAGDHRVVGSPITAVHLWFDRDVVDLPHAVLVGRVSQWVFRGGDGGPATGYCQVVISASRGLLADGRESLVTRVVDDLRAVFPAAREARLREARVVTDPTAVLSVRPGVDALRPPAATAVRNLAVAGDWTATGWPSTMEGAIRSGRLAAAALGKHLGLDVPGVAADLPKNGLVRLLLGG